MCYTTSAGEYTVLSGVLCAGHSGDATKGINCVPQLDTGVLGSIPPRRVDVCHTSVFVLSCVRKGRCTSQSPVPVKVKQSRYRPGMAQRVPGR